MSFYTYISTGVIMKSMFIPSGLEHWMVLECCRLTGIPTFLSSSQGGFALLWINDGLLVVMLMRYQLNDIHVPSEDESQFFKMNSNKKMWKTKIEGEGNML